MLSAFGKISVILNVCGDDNQLADQCMKGKKYFIAAN